jgi:hypothetical protein
MFHNMVYLSYHVCLENMKLRAMDEANANDRATSPGTESPGRADLTSRTLSYSHCHVCLLLRVGNAFHFSIGTHKASTTLYPI